MSPDMTNDHRVHDRMTSLFTGEFLECHLENQIESLADELSPHSFMTLQLSSMNDGNAAARKALPQLARMLMSELRQTDCAGRIDWSTIGVSLRGTSYAGGVQLAERFMAKLNGERFSPAAISLPAGVTLVWRIIEKRRYHSAIDLINAGKKGPQTRVLYAA